MAGASVTFDLSQLASVERSLRAAQARAQDLSPLMDQIGMAMETTTHERFETESDPAGNEWEKSAAAIARSGKTLTDQTHLDNSNTHRATSDTVEIGSNLIYAGVHQDGINETVTVKAHTREISVAYGRRLPAALTVNIPSFERQFVLPARPFLGIGGDDEETIMELTGNYLLGEMAE